MDPKIVFSTPNFFELYLICDANWAKFYAVIKNKENTIAADQQFIPQKS